MKKIITILIILSTLELHSEVNFREYEIGKVNTNGLDLRSEPSFDSEIVKQLDEGTTLYIVGRTDYPQINNNDVYYWFKVMLDVTGSSYWAYGKDIITDLNNNTPKNYIEEQEIKSALKNKDYKELERLSKLSDQNNWGFNNKLLWKAIGSKDYKAVNILLDNNASGSYMAVHNFLLEYTTLIHAIIYDVDEEICLKMITKTTNFEHKYYFPDKKYNIVNGKLFSAALIYNKSLLIKEMLKIDENLLKQKFTVVNEESGEQWEYTGESYIKEHDINW